MRHKLFIPCFGVLSIMIFSTKDLNAEASDFVINTANAEELFDPAPYGFSHAILAKGVNEIAFIAGQGGEDKDGNLDENFGTQVRQAYKNLLLAFRSTGAQPKHVTKLTTYVVNYDQSKLETLTRELKTVFGEHLPAQTLVPVPRLALDGMLFEVDATAVLGN